MRFEIIYPVRLAIVCVVAPVLTACSVSQPLDALSSKIQPLLDIRLSAASQPMPAVISVMKRAARKSINDPYSAQWRGMRQATRPDAKGEPTDVVCGYVNSRQFVYFVERQDIMIAGNGTPAERSAIPGILKKFCAGLV